VLKKLKSNRGFTPLEIKKSGGKAGKLRKSLTGFTIIEVLIVLAIAGLILLIVFLAVPALQRNSRNTQRKNDVARMLAGMSEWANNNGGALPPWISFTGGFSWASDSSGTNGLKVKLGYYPANNANISLSTATGTLIPATDPEVVIFNESAKCNPDGSADMASSRQAVAQYALEGGSGPVAQCQGI